MILPYWFRAYRIKKLLEHATIHFQTYSNEHNTTNNFLQSAKTKLAIKHYKSSKYNTKQHKHDKKKKSTKSTNKRTNSTNPGNEIITPSSTREMHRHETGYKNNKKEGKNETKRNKNRNRFSSNDTSINTTHGSHSIDDISMDISIDSHSSVTLDSTLTQSNVDLSGLQRALYLAKTLEVWYLFVCFLFCFFFHFFFIFACAFVQANWFHFIRVCCVWY